MSDQVRDLALERRLTLQAAPAENLAAAKRLSDFAAERAGEGPVLDLGTRDFATEVLEELADARNYLLWWREQLGRHAASAVVHAALSDVIVAYDRVLDAQRRSPLPERAPRPALVQALDETRERWPGCRCALHPRMTNADLIAMEAGCTAPRWCCPRLDAVRRRLIRAGAAERGGDGPELAA